MSVLIFSEPDYPEENEVKVLVTYDYGAKVGTYAGEPLFPPQCVHSALAPLPQRLEVSLA